MVLVIAISYTLTPYVGPSNEDPILTNEKTGANLTAVMWADPQFSNYLVERTRDLTPLARTLHTISTARLMQLLTPAI